MHFKALCNRSFLIELTAKTGPELSIHFRINSQILRAMKLSALLIFVACLQVSAKGHAQITLSENNAPLEKIFKAIQSQSDYVFFYDYALLKQAKTVNLKVKKVSLTEVLDACFKDQPLTYTIVNKTIVVKQKEELKNEKPLQQELILPDINVSGLVTEAATGNPLSGASIKLKGTDIGTSTDAKGNFTLQIPDAGGILAISYVGYESDEVRVSRTGYFKVSLKLKDSQADEVIVVGYGSLRKKDVTGSSSRVNEQIIKETPPTTLENAIQGRMPGVVVTNTSAEPGGGVSIQIRGLTSLSGNNQPLYVIDGVPMYNDNSRSAAEFEANVPTNFLSTINPSDVLSVEVLKDASATAIYGSRGANGVILITTKRGKIGKAKIDFNHYTLVAEAPQPIRLANAKEYANYYNTLMANSGMPLQYTGQYYKSSNNLDSLYFPSPTELGEGTNWQKEIFRSAITQNYQVNVSGGSPSLKYMLSGNYLDDEGVVKISKYRRGSLRANLDATATDKFSIKFDVNLTTDINDRAENSNARGLVGGFERSGVILKSFVANPVWSVDNTTSKQQGNFNNTQFYTTMLNPLFDLENTINQRKINFTLANADLNYKFSPSFNLTVRGGYNLTNASTDMFWNLNSQLGYLRGQKTFQSSWKSTSYLNENFLTFNRQTSKYNLNVVGGVSWQKNILLTSVLGGEGLPIPTGNGLYLLPLYNSRDIPNTNRIDELLLSGYGRVAFSYDSRYLLTVTARGDGSSHFAANKKWAFFPSMGVGWNFMEEKFLSGIKPVVSSGKLRASYGTSGNQAIAAYQSLPSLAPISFGFISGAITGVTTQSPGNTDLTWETTTQLDVGLELSFLNDRWKFALDAYKKRTEDLLQSKAILSQSGYTSILSNFGTIENRGIELELSGNIIKNKQFQWDASFNAATNQIKVIDLGPGIKYYNYTSGATGGNDYTHRITVGGSLGTFWGFKTDGLLTAKDIADGYPKLTPNLTEGQIKVLDVNGDKVINDLDKGDLGHAYPKYTLGLSNSFSYANFSLNIFLNAALGQKVLNQNKVWSEYGSTTGIPTKAYIDDYWTPDNLDAYFPKPSLTNPNFQTMDRIVEDGSYLRIKLISLRYNFTQLPKWVTKLQLYVTVNNLYTFTKYTGYDPEVSAYGQNNFLAGIDLGSYPRTRSVAFGLEVGF